MDPHHISLLTGEVQTDSSRSMASMEAYGAAGAGRIK